MQPQYIGQPLGQYGVTDLTAAHHDDILAAGNFLSPLDCLRRTADEAEPVAQPGLVRRSVGDDEDRRVHFAGRLGAVPHLVAPPTGASMMSKSVRPCTTAPVSSKAASSTARSASVPWNTQLCTASPPSPSPLSSATFGPATYPSTDTEMSTTT